MIFKKTGVFLICIAFSLSASAADSSKAVLSTPNSSAQNHRVWDARATQVLMQARWSYWQGFPLRAIRDYRYLLHIAPENHLADLYGELGNVYYQMETYYAAGVAFSHCVRILIRERKFQGALNLLPIIARTDSGEAQKLRIQLDNQETPYRDGTSDYGNTLAVSASYRWPF